MRFFFLMLIVSAQLFSSCILTKKQTTAHDHTVVKHDTVIVERNQVVRDTTILVKPDSSILKALIECDKKGRAYLKQITEIKPGQKIITKIIQKHDTLIFRANIDSAKIYFTWKQTHIKETNKQSTVENTTDKTAKTVVKYRCPFWIWGILIAAVMFVMFKYLWPIIRILM